jgi:hypothetical protein
MEYFIQLAEMKNALFFGVTVISGSKLAVIV